MTPESVPQTANPGTTPGAPGLASETWVATDAPRISEARRLFWSIRRELWENRAIYIAPLAVAAFILLGFFYSTLRMPAGMLISTTVDNNGVVTHTSHGLDPILPYTIAAGLIMATTVLVGVFYCLDALYGERRDRSILFWKSLPVSDLTTVLSKASIPLVILPLLTWAITVVTQSLMLLINVTVYHARGIDTGPLHSGLPLTQNSMMLLYHLIAIHALWYAPIWCWFLLVSAWARRTPLLWATLPPIVLGVLEMITLHSGYVFDFLKYRLHGPEGSDVYTAGSSMSMQMPLTPAHFLTTPGLWTGLALAAVFLAAAIQLRRYRNPL
jgi:ABC-2 type transport system permease protein